MEKFVINVGRQLGSGGREISTELAKRLDISYFDKELLSVAAEATYIRRIVRHAFPLQRIVNLQHHELSQQRCPVSVAE